MQESGQKWLELRVLHVVYSTEIAAVERLQDSQTCNGRIVKVKDDDRWT